MLLIGLRGLIAHGLSANPLAKWLAAKESGGGYLGTLLIIDLIYFDMPHLF
jgi:hypothetical protein